MTIWRISASPVVMPKWENSCRRSIAIKIAAIARRGHPDWPDRKRPAIARGPPARRAKGRSSNLVWRWTGQFFGGIPACDPRLDAVQRNRVAAMQKFTEPTPVLGDIGPHEIDNRIEQRHSVGKNRC